MGPATSVRGRAAQRRRTQPMSTINVTPMVDVMLVLLVIFMVTAPLLTVGVEVDLPDTAATPVQGQDEPLAVTIDAAGTVYLQDTAVTIENLPARLAAVADAKPELRVFVRGDAGVAYGKVMEVVGIVDAAGLRRIALETEPLPPAPAAKGKGSR